VGPLFVCSETSFNDVHEFCYDVHIHARVFVKRTKRRSHKHFQLDAAKIKRAQKALRTKTETETIERALELAITEEEKNRLALEANERFLKSGVEIKDVYGVLND
jgi:hypothetical protein